LEITESLGIRNDSISKSLRRLLDIGLINGDRGSYVINPIIFWKGDKAKRKELLENEGLKVEFNFKIDNK
jgi:predicted transcriptional regulator